VPGITRVALVGRIEGSEADRGQQVPPKSRTGVVMRALGIEPLLLYYWDPATVPALIRGAALQGVQGLVFDPAFPFYQQPVFGTIVREAERVRMPVMYTMLSAVADGGLMAHGTDPAIAWRRIPAFVDRILRGANPAEIPIEEPSKVEFHVNVRAAKAIGLEIPSSVLLRADRVFQ
jgi:putative ABC transport system substrate-binding protein